MGVGEKALELIKGYQGDDLVEMMELIGDDEDSYLEIERIAGDIGGADVKLIRRRVVAEHRAAELVRKIGAVKVLDLKMRPELPLPPVSDPLDQTVNTSAPTDPAGTDLPGPGDANKSTTEVSTTEKSDEVTTMSFRATESENAVTVEVKDGAFSHGVGKKDKAVGEGVDGEVVNDEHKKSYFIVSAAAQIKDIENQTKKKIPGIDIPNMNQGHIHFERSNVVGTSIFAMTPRTYTKIGYASAGKDKKDGTQSPSSNELAIRRVKPHLPAGINAYALTSLSLAAVDVKTKVLEPACVRVAIWSETHNDGAIELFIGGAHYAFYRCASTRTLDKKCVITSSSDTYRAIQTVDVMWSNLAITKRTVSLFATVNPVANAASKDCSILNILTKDWCGESTIYSLEHIEHYNATVGDNPVTRVDHYRLKPVKL